MFASFGNFRCGPIGLDIGARWLKLVQFSADQTRLIDAVRVEMPAHSNQQAFSDTLAQAWKKARLGRDFRGNEAVVCISDPQLFLQNIRVQRAGGDLERLVKQEAYSRIPFPAAEAEIRYLEAGDVRQASAVFREVIVLACHRPVIAELIVNLDKAGVHPLAVEVEPLALLRAGLAQLRRESDQNQRALFAHIGYSRTLIVVAQGDEPLMIKYLDLGGKDFDAAVAHQLEMELAGAATLRRNAGDRRQEQQDPEVNRTIAEALRPVIDKLQNEIMLCLRYHSVAFRGHPLTKIMLSGGEASTLVQTALNSKMDLKCELSEPFRAFSTAPNSSRRGQWDIAVGLALRESLA